MGCRKQTAVPDRVPRDQLGSPRRCPGLSLPRSLCSSPSATRSSSQAPVPTPARGNAAGCEIGVGRLGLCFHIQTARLPPSCHSSRIGFAVTFWGYQARAGWVGVLWPQNSSYLGFPSFQATVTLSDPTGSWLQGLRAFQVVWGMRCSRQS